MKLTSIKLENFRQFSGQQELRLSSDEMRPVTLVFGANGSGKTTLLNAFTWALYGNMSDDVEQQERLITDVVWRSAPVGSNVKVSVELCFTHEDQYFQLIRSASVRKESDHQHPTSADMDLWIRLEDGSSVKELAPQQRIDRILPEGVSRFFFFNGERIENLVKKEAYTEVQKDIKLLLELEHVERALEVLPKVDRRFSMELRKYGGEKASQIQEDIDSLSDQHDQALDRAAVIQADVKAIEAEAERVLDLLRENADTAPIQKARDRVENELSEAKIARDSANDERSHIIGTRGFTAFTEVLGRDTKEMAEELYRKGALPAPLKREFVDELLSSGKCICGSDLTEHSDSWAHVHKWRKRAGLQAVETAWQKLSVHIDDLDSTRASLRSDLAGVAKRIGEENDRVNRLVAEKSELDGKLRGSRLENVQELESRHMDLTSRVRSQHQNIGAVRTEIERLAKELESKRKQRADAEVTDVLAIKAKARLELVQSVRKALTEIRDFRAMDMRVRLDQVLKEVFSSITHQSHVPTLTSNFELVLNKNVDGVELPVPKSTGENQILSLSFVAAVSKLAREVQSRRLAEGPGSDDGGSFPIVMDAAFGSLDQDYQETVSRALAKMAPQLVVFVSKSQGMGKVLTELMPRVSNLGILETHTTAPGDISDNIVISGTEYPYIRNSDADYTEIKVIK